MKFHRTKVTKTFSVFDGVYPLGGKPITCPDCIEKCMLADELLQIEEEEEQKQTEPEPAHYEIEKVLDKDVYDKET